MLKFLTAFLVLTTITVFSYNYPNHSGRFLAYSSSKPEYDYYKFAKEWPGSTCYEESCNYDVLTDTQWNQHGLWPNKWHTYNIPNCSTEAWNMDAFSSDQMKELRSFWDGMYSSDGGFWKHEWEKHGRCWRPDFGDLSKMTSDQQTAVKQARSDYANGNKMITDYFHTVYEVQKPLDFYKALSDAGIVPNNDKEYDLDKVIQAFSKYFGVQNFDVLCKYKDGYSLLNEVRICLDKNYQVMECTGSEHKCDESVLYPKHHS